MNIFKTIALATTAIALLACETSTPTPTLTHQQKSAIASEIGANYLRPSIEACLGYLTSQKYNYAKLVSAGFVAKDQTKYFEKDQTQYFKTYTEGNFSVEVKAYYTTRGWCGFTAQNTSQEIISPTYITSIMKQNGYIPYDVRRGVTHYLGSNGHKISLYGTIGSREIGVQIHNSK